MAVYRIVAEALSNAVRHGRAQHVTVSLARTSEGVEVAVADDGTGTLAPREGGVGLQSMHERAEEIGGRLRAESVTGVGTTVTASLPLAAGSANGVLG